MTALERHLGGFAISSRDRRPDVGATGLPPGAGGRTDTSRIALARALGDRLEAAVTFVTTEHFNLQTARAATIVEANGRASIYLAVLSGDLIALALIGQLSLLGTAFYAFALISLPAVAFIGLVTSQRLVQSSVEEIAYAQRIGRLRGLYLSVAPELAPYLTVVTAAPGAAAMPLPRPRPSDWQLMLTTAGMVAVVNSIVIGACAGLFVSLVADPLAFTLVTGALIGTAALAAHRMHHRHALDAYKIEGIDLAAISAPEAQP